MLLMMPLCMKTLLIIYLCMLGNVGGTVQIISNEGSQGIQGEFVIVLKKSNVQRIDKTGTKYDWNRLKDDLMEKASLTVQYVITIGDFKAAFVNTDEHQLQGILEDTDIDYIEMNQKIRVFKQIMNCGSDTMEAQCKVQNTGSDIWGLSRLNQRETLDVNTSLAYSWMTNGDGTGVDAYVLDTGIFVEHSEFEGRVSHGYTSRSIAISEDGEDHHGHGTHVAGTIGGETTGVAKGVHLISVKVLAANGEGTIFDLLQGLEFVYRNHRNRQSSNRRTVKSVINMSLGAEGSSPVLEKAITALVEDGIPVVVAAGNSYRYACGFTPASVSDAITVGSTTIVDDLSPFSNFGHCVDILAPGSHILSAWNYNITSMAYASGTSMAAPHVTGVVARYLSQWNGNYPATIPWEIKQTLLNTAVVNKVNLSITHFGELVVESTPNFLLHITGCT